MRVKVEPQPGQKPAVYLDITRDELEQLMLGHSLRFVAKLPDGDRSVELMRDDTTPIGPAPDVRLRVPRGALEGIRAEGNTVTPIFLDVPLSLTIKVAAAAVTPSPPQTFTHSATTPAKPTSRASGWSTVGAGVFFLLMGAVRSGMSSRGHSTNSFMVLIGVGILIYGVYQLATKR